MRKSNSPRNTEGVVPNNLLRPIRRKSIPKVEFMLQTFPDEEPLLGTVITHGSTGMLSAQRGLGKSLLAMHIAYAIAGGKPLKPWGRGVGAVVTYLDGEMHSRTLQKRLRQISNRDTKRETREMADRNLHIIGRDVFEHVIGYIDNEDDQAYIESMLPDECRLLIVDNLSAWTSSAREDGTAFAPIKRWLAYLRTKGIAVLLIHHTGKNGSSQRGTSIHEDLLDYSILLREDKSGKPKHGTSFLLEHTKLRELHPDIPKTCRYTFTTDPITNVMDHHYEDGGTVAVSENESAIVELLKQGFSGKEVAEKLEVSSSLVSRLKTVLPGNLRAEIEASQAIRAAAKKSGKEAS
jgi:putative DNA primase/helicase